MWNTALSNTARNIVQLPQLRRHPTATARPAATSAVPFDEWVTVRDRAAAALLGGTTRLLLTGPAGTGKTVLIDHVARVLRAAGRTVTVQLADADPAPPDLGTTLFVDEANRLTPAQLKTLGAAPGTLLLAGLGTPALRRVSGALPLALAPLGPEAAQRYIALWLELTGRTTADLDSKGVRRLVDLSGGTPRLLATLLSASAWVAETSGAATIGADHVDEAADLRSVLAPPSVATLPSPESASPSRRRAVWSAALAGLVVIGTAAAVAPRLFPDQAAPLLDRAAQVAGKAESWLRQEHSVAKVAPEPKSAEPVTPAPQIAMNPPVPQPRPAPEAVAAPAPATVVADRPAAPPAPETVAPSAETAAVALPEPVREAAIVAPLQPEPIVAPTAPAKATIGKLPIETVEFLLRRGREMLQIDDLSAARLLFRRVAEDGNAEAMFELGQTFDPATLASRGAIGLADRDEAMRWYARAAAAGYRSAKN